MGKCVQYTLMIFNIICLIGGIAMLAGGILVLYSPQTAASLTTLAGIDASSTQLASIAYAMAALGCFIILVSFVGCCGAMSESKCLMAIYFVLILLLFIGQLVIGILAVIAGKTGVSDQLQSSMTGLSDRYHENAKTLDLIQETFQCCGPNGSDIYAGKMPVTSSPLLTTLLNMNTTTTTTVAPSTTTLPPTTVFTTLPQGIASNATTNVTVPPVATPATNRPLPTDPWWPDSCCRRNGTSYVDLTQCRNYKQTNTATLTQYVYTQGCVDALAAFIDKNLLIIGGCALALAALELFALILAFKLYRSMD